MYGPDTGIVMDVYTDQPGVQLYIGNFLDGTMPIKGGNGEGYQARTGLCLETQYYPDSVNHPEWPQPFLKPGEKMCIRDRPTTIKSSTWVLIS